MDRTQLDELLAAIASRIEPGATLLEHRPLTGGVSAHIHAVRYRSGDGRTREVVVRRHGAADWKPRTSHVTRVEYTLLTALHTAGLAVPEPLLLDVSGDLFPSPYLVLEMVPGTTKVAAAQLDTALAQMAAFLVRLHTLSVAAEVSEVLPAREDPVTGALQYLPNTPELANERAIIANWQVSSAPRALLHGDFWPGNVIWREERLAAVIDWEDAALGSAMSDLAACRAELMVAYGNRPMDRFTDHYLASSTLDTSDLVLWEIYVSSAALATLADWGLAPDVESRRRTATAAFLQAALQRLRSLSL